MKLTHFSRYLKFALCLAILCSFTNAYAYDFEADGIYYYITSNNTVQVTYEDTNFDYNSYSGSVSIPSTVTRNNKTYTVTAIGDSAFYSSMIYEVSIPSTVTKIGRAAFLSPLLTVITCLATTPPELDDNCFDHHGYGYNWMPWYEGQCKKDYAGQKKTIYMPEYAGWDLFLYIPEESFDDYKALNEINHFFSFVINIGADVTQFKEEGAEIHTCYALYNGFTHSLETWSYWDEGMTFDYTDPQWGSSVDVYGYSYAIKEGKAPSGIYISWSEHYSYYDHLEDLLYEEVWEENEDLYDFVVDGNSYNVIDENSVVVASGIHIYLVWANQYYYYYTINHAIKEYDCYRVNDTNGHFVIPSTVTYEGNTYNVVGISDNAFSEYFRWYECEELGYNEVYPGPVSSSFAVYTGPCWVNCLTLPVSLSYIGENAFYGCDNIKYLHITGEGEWTAGALDVAVQRLDIASGITAIPGLKVNPREVYCYANVPPTCDENTFTDYTGTLHVPESSLAAYFTAPYWCNFANIVGDAAELTDLTLNKDSAELLVDEQLTLNATIQPANANIDSITWESSNPSVATVTNDGVVTAKSLGECDIIVTCLDKRAICHIKVVEQVTTITLDQHRASLLPNHILTLTPTVTPEPTDLVVTSSNPSVAAARLANGKVQVVGVSVGTAIIKVASADGNAVADSCFVNVYTEAGDVDGDGFVKIDDVTALIDHLLGSNSSIDVGNADINYDGVISIADVTELIDYLLGGSASMTTRETFTVNGVSFTMIRVPAGSFMMGATEEQGSDANSWEKPVHEVTLSNSYLIGETEVTQELWLAVMGTNPSKHEGSLQKPVENVSWLDCQEFISRLNELTGLSFRMPTEAEWEYAARGANRSRGYKYAGSNNIADVGNVSSSTTMPVGSLQPNELNIYDMSGNVDEWVWDLFGYYTSEPQIDPTGPADGGSDHMYRGGSWYSGANTARVSYRFFRASTFKRGTMGLRLAL